jgi:hypothetical protein
MHAVGRVMPRDMVYVAVSLLIAGCASAPPPEFSDDALAKGVADMNRSFAVSFNGTDPYARSPHPHRRRTAA